VDGGGGGREKCPAPCKKGGEMSRWEHAGNI